MMKTKAPKIIIIHDDLQKNDPLIIELGIKYSSGNILLFNNSKDGLEFIRQNLSEKIIVILDLKFKGNEPSGADVFEDIRKMTSLVFVIIWTASHLNEINPEDLKRFINNYAMALLSSTDDTETILGKVEEAEHQLDVKIASALEQWISNHSEDEKGKPYITTRGGKVFSLNEILDEIRRQTPFGMTMEKNILLLAIDLLARGKKDING